MRVPYTSGEIPHDGHAPSERQSIAVVADDVACSCGPVPQPPPRSLVGDASRAIARLFAKVVDGAEHPPVLSVTPAAFDNGVVIVLQSRLSPAAVDRLIAVVDALDR